MALTYEQFRDRFPEFDSAPRTFVEAKLAEAALQIDFTTWGARGDLGHGYLAAHLLSIAPTGQHARLQPRTAKITQQDALTTYEREYRRLQLIATAGLARVVGAGDTSG